MNRFDNFKAYELHLIKEGLINIMKNYNDISSENFCIQILINEIEEEFKHV